MTASVTPNQTTADVSVTDRLARLQAFAGDDPQSAQDAVWAWLSRVGERLPAAEAELELAQLFAAGTPADVDGQTEGLLVGFTEPTTELGTAGRVIHALASAMTGPLGLMPWLGKKFDQAAGRGTNSVSFLAVALTAALAPRYRMRRAGEHWEGFDMLNRVEESVISPGTQVLVLDYETIGTNPWPINQIRDEAVQLVPGIYLGAKLLNQTNGYQQLAYWAARSPLT